MVEDNQSISNRPKDLGMVQDEGCSPGTRIFPRMGADPEVRKPALIQLPYKDASIVSPTSRYSSQARTLSEIADDV